MALKVRFLYGLAFAIHLEQNSIVFSAQLRGSPDAIQRPSPAITHRRPSMPLPKRTAELVNTAKPLARLASAASSMVTPTPKKAKNDSKPANYNRRKKSLGYLAEKFLTEYQGLPVGSTIIVDKAAIDLGVERRRIYDVVNIFESIQLVSKKHKNTYTWLGKAHLDAVFGRLQAQAMVEYPNDAEKFLGSRLSNTSFAPLPVKKARKVGSSSRENKSLSKLSQDFLQVFLVGHTVLSLPQASDKIQGATSQEELVAMGMNRIHSGVAAPCEKELKAAAARGLKTKIRRLYDIANVFLSVGLLRKVDGKDSSRRPNFAWAYRLTAQELYNLFRPSQQQVYLANQKMEEQPPSV